MEENDKDRKEHRLLQSTETKTQLSSFEDFFKRAAGNDEYSLDSSSIEVSGEMIGCGGTSEVFRGYLEGRAVAVKRLRLEVAASSDLTELKDLMTETNLMCRFSRKDASNLSSLDEPGQLRAMPSQLTINDLFQPWLFWQKPGAPEYNQVLRHHRRHQCSQHGAFD